jgi:hypothetical protein
MSEEKPSEPLEFFILTFGIIIISIFAAKSLIDAINIFIYFFSKANTEVVSDQISELITVSAGTPGNVEISFVKPEGSDYNVYFKGKIVIVEAYNYKKPIGLSDEDLEKIFNKTYSSTSVDLESKEFLDFYIIKIQKKEKITIDAVGDLD